MKDFVLARTGAAGAGALDRGLHRGLLAVDIVTARKLLQVRKLVASFLCQALAAFLLRARDAELMKAEALARECGHLLDRLCRQRRGMTIAALRQWFQFDHIDAIHRTGRKTQIAAGTELGEHRVHAFRGADNGIDRTGLDAQHAADATRLVDQCGNARCLRSVRGVEWFFRPTEQPRQVANSRGTARRALVDVGVATGKRLRVRTTALVSAFRALGLRQQRVYGVD